MKKTLIMIILAVIVGFSFGYLFLRKFNNEVITEVSSIKSQCYAFQIGVYRNKENALKAANDSRGIVILDNDFYRVYIALLKDENLIESLKSYYDTKNVNYYLKAIYISDKTSSILDNYEIILKRTSIDNYEAIIENMLKEVDSSEL